MTKEYKTRSRVDFIKDGTINIEIFVGNVSYGYFEGMFSFTSKVYPVGWFAKRKGITLANKFEEEFRRLAKKADEKVAELNELAETRARLLEGVDK